ncbi:hypothetical protein D3C87_2105370 [compost metagenome]
MEICFLLHAAGVGRDQERMLLEHHHVDVTERLEDPDVGRNLQPEGSDSLLGTRMQG